MNKCSRCTTLTSVEEYGACPKCGGLVGAQVVSSLNPMSIEPCHGDACNELLNKKSAGLLKRSREANDFDNTAAWQSSKGYNSWGR